MYVLMNCSVGRTSVLLCIFNRFSNVSPIRSWKSTSRNSVRGPSACPYSNYVFGSLKIIKCSD